MARDEAMMFPNDRIRKWLANNRENSQEMIENSLPKSEPPSQDELVLELETAESLQTDFAG